MIVDEIAKLNAEIASAFADRGLELALVIPVLVALELAVLVYAAWTTYRFVSERT